jgi:hypothetical protein
MSRFYTGLNIIIKRKYNFKYFFTSILTSRLSNFSDETDFVTKSQAGFRAGYSTEDNIFILYSLITLYLSKKMKLFCCFIYFKKAFDTIWRAGLWQKLINSNIHGKIFKIIFSSQSLNY